MWRSYFYWPNYFKGQFGLLLWPQCSHNNASLVVFKHSVRALVPNASSTGQIVVEIFFTSTVNAAYLIYNLLFLPTPTNTIEVCLAELLDEIGDIWHKTRPEDVDQTGI